MAACIFRLNTWKLATNSLFSRKGKQLITKKVAWVHSPVSGVTSTQPNQDAVIHLSVGCAGGFLGALVGLGGSFIVIPFLNQVLISYLYYSVLYHIWIT